MLQGRHRRRAGVRACRQPSLWRWCWPGGGGGGGESTHVGCLLAVPPPLALRLLRLQVAQAVAACQPSCQPAVAAGGQGCDVWGPKRWGAPGCAAGEPRGCAHRQPSKERGGVTCPLSKQQAGHQARPCGGGCSRGLAPGVKARRRGRGRAGAARCTACAATDCANYQKAATASAASHTARWQAQLQGRHLRWLCKAGNT